MLLSTPITYKTLKQIFKTFGVSFLQVQKAISQCAQEQSINSK
jgi:hypothetical protein